MEALRDYAEKCSHYEKSAQAAFLLAVDMRNTFPSYCQEWVYWDRTAISHKLAAIHYQMMRDLYGGKMGREEKNDRGE